MQSLRAQLIIVIGACLALLLSYVVLEGQPRRLPNPPNPIPNENQQPGTDEWRLNRPGFRIADDRSNQIKGYASATSVNGGGTLPLHISVSPAQSYVVDVYRIGWYSGKGGRLMLHSGSLEGMQQSTCVPDPTTGLTDCHWPVSYLLNVPTSWTSGIYLALLTNEQNYQNYIIFVVRNDTRTPNLLYKQPVNTYQAYNNYPDDGVTGKSLYESNSVGPNTLARTARALKVSFDRPYAQHGAGDFFSWELQLVRWLERNNYDVGYTTDVDMHTSAPQQLVGLKGVLSPGHDEYWSTQMYDNARAARDHGVNLAFLGADPDYWHVRYESSAAGDERRVLVCYRESALDPVAEPMLKTVLWRDPPLNQPEQQLVGVQYVGQLSSNSNYVVSDNSSWVFANSGLRPGDTVLGITGYEVDAYEQQYPPPEARPNSYTILSRSPAVGVEGRPIESHSSVYQAPGGAWVFATGTMSWSWALDGDGYDPRIDRATSNVMDAFVSGTLPAAAAPAQPQTAYASLVLQSNPLVYWRLDETTARGFTDVTRHGLDATFQELTTVTSPPDGYAPAVAPVLSGMRDFTITGWTYLNNPEWNADANYNNTLYATFGKVRMLVRPGAPSNTTTLGLFQIWLNGAAYDIQPPTRGTSNIDAWVAWAFLRQGNVLQVYRDGVLVGQRSDLPPDAVADVSGALFADRSGAYPLSGWVDDVAIFPRALDAATISQLYYAAPTERLPSAQAP